MKVGKEDKIEFLVKELSTIRCGLEVAEEEYRKHYRYTKPTSDRVSKQFLDQAEDVKRIHDFLNELGY